MKFEEITEFLIEWGDDQRLTIFEGLAVASNVLDAGPLPVQVGVRVSTYMALGNDVPGIWLQLFENALDPAAVQADQVFVSRVDNGFITQAISLAPCEQGEHLHASVTLTHVMPVAPEQTKEAIKAALFESWRDTGDKMTELQGTWVHPFLERALDLESLHGGRPA